MAVEYGNDRIPTDGLVFYINGADRNCFVSGSFSGKQLAGSYEALNFQNQLRFYPQFGGYWEIIAPNQGLNGSGSLAFSSTITFPNQYTHIIVMRRNGTTFENQNWVRPVLASGRATHIGGDSSNISLGNGNSKFSSTTSISNSTDWFFGAGKNELVAASWTQSLYVRGFDAGTRVYETKTQVNGSTDWTQGTGSWTGMTLASSLVASGLGLYMSYNRALSLEEIDTIYLSIRGRFNLPTP